MRTGPKCLNVFNVSNKITVQLLYARFYQFPRVAYDLAFPLSQVIEVCIMYIYNRPVSFGTKPQNPKLTNPKQFWTKLMDPKPKDLI